MSSTPTQYWDEDGFLGGQHVSEAQRAVLHAFLHQHYNATVLLECFPFLLIGCKGGPPSERPFSVAGAIAIWKDADDFNFKPLVGDLGQGDEIDIEPAMLDRLVPLEIPPREVITYLANQVFPRCEAISVLWQMLVVELPAVSKLEHLDRLENLPSDISCCPLILRFHNGPLPNSRRGAIKPSLASEVMAMEAAPKTFLSADQQNIGDVYLFDSFSTGKQLVSGFGRRFTMGWSTPGGEDMMPVKYIASEQGAFVTNSPEIVVKLHIRDSVCGSVLLRCKKRGQEAAVLEQGEIGGILLFCDLQSKSAGKAENYIMYADAFAPLIEAGWFVQQTEDDGKDTGTR